VTVETRRARDRARKREQRATTRREAAAARKAALVGPSLPTAHDVRQVIPVPSVAERLDALGLLRDAAEPAVAAAVSAAVRDHEHGYIPPVRARVTFDDQYVTYWWNAVRLCGAAEMVDARYEAGKRSRAGRKANLSTRTVLTAMMVSALAGKPMLVSEFTTFLYERLSPPVAELLDVHRPTHDPTKTARARSVRRRDAEYGNVRRAVHRILSTIDPSIHPKGQVRRWLDLASTKRDLTVEEQQEMQAALDMVCSQLLTIPWTMLPANVRAQYRGHVGIDATPAKAFAVGKGVHGTDAATDPDAGWYFRSGTHAETDAYDANGAPRPGRRKSMFGYDVTMLIASDATTGPNQYVPAIPIAISLDRPGCDPAGAARRVFAQFLHHGHTPGYLAADGLYAPLKVDTFHKEVFNAGFAPLFWFPRRMLGQAGTVNGMVHVEGRYYSPSLPDELTNANADYRDGLITEEIRDARLRERDTYAMRAHGHVRIETLAGVHDVVTRWVCPAHGGQKRAVAACPNKPESMRKRKVTRTPDGKKTDGRALISLTPTLTGNPPRPCRNATVPSGPYDKLAYRQALPYATPEWRTAYRALRQAHEGFHGYSKDDAKEAIGHASRRRIRGIAAASLFITVLVTAAAIRKVLRFLEDAQLDRHGHLHVTRPSRKDRAYKFGREEDDEPPDEQGDGPDPDDPTNDIT